MSDPVKRRVVIAHVIVREALRELVLAGKLPAARARSPQLRAELQAATLASLPPLESGKGLSAEKRTALVAGLEAVGLEAAAELENGGAVDGKI